MRWPPKKNLIINRDVSGGYCKTAVSRWPFSQNQIKMKKVQLFNTMESFEEFINRTDIEVIQVDVKVVEQSYMFQQSFAAVVFYRMLS